MYEVSGRFLETRNIDITLTKVREDKGRKQGQSDIERAADG